MNGPESAQDGHQDLQNGGPEPDYDRNEDTNDRLPEGLLGNGVRFGQYVLPRLYALIRAIIRGEMRPSRKPYHLNPLGVRWTSNSTS